MDAERAPKLDVEKLRRSIGVKGFVVYRPHERKSKIHEAWVDFGKVLQSYNGNTKLVLDSNPGTLPDDNATIFFTSGTLVFPFASEVAFLNYL